MIYSLSKKDFLVLLKDVSDKLSENNIEHEIPYCYIDKENFNYIDIIIPDFININDLILNLNISNPKEENGILEGEIEKFRFNFIKTPVDYMNIAFYHYCWNFFLPLIKALLKPINLEYNIYGLYYNVNGNKKIFLTKNIQKIMDFLGIDFRKIYGINLPNKSILFQEIINSDFFNIDSFDKSILKEIDTCYRFNEKYYRDFLSIAPLTNNIVMDNQEILDSIDNFFPESNFSEKLIKMTLNKNFDLSKIREKVIGDINKTKPVEKNIKPRKKIKLKRMKPEDLKYKEIGDTIYLEDSYLEDSDEKNNKN
jgi:hypothetical protein